MKMATTTLVALSLLALAAALPVQAAGTFTTNPADFSDLTAEDFEDTGFAIGTGFGGCGGCIAPSLVVPGFQVYPQSPVDGAVLGEDCYLSLPLETKWIGTLSSALVIELAGSETRVGFDYGSQFFQRVQITVETSDGLTHTLMPPDQNANVSCPAFGVAGFVGFDTGDPTVTIDKIYADVSDGGIDNVRCSDCGIGSVAVEPTGWGTVKSLYR